MLRIDKRSTFVPYNPTPTNPLGPPQDLSLTDPTWSYGHGAAYRAMFLEILGDWAKKVDVSSSVRLLQYDTTNMSSHQLPARPDSKTLIQASTPSLAISSWRFQQTLYGSKESRSGQPLTRKENSLGVSVDCWLSWLLT